MDLEKVYYGAEKGAVAKMNDETQKLMSIKLNKLLQEYEPNLIICTHPFASHMCAILKRRKNQLQNCNNYYRLCAS